MSLTVSRLARHMAQMGLITVGAKGRFATLSEAIDFVIANGAPVDVTPPFNGTISVAAFADIVTLAGATVPWDHVTLANPRLSDRLWIEYIFTPVTAPAADVTDYLHPVSRMISSTSLRTVAGHGYWWNDGESDFNYSDALAGVAYRLWRYPMYTIKLLPGRHTLSAQADLGLAQRGAYVDIVGSGAGSTILQIDSYLQNIRHPVSGYFGLSDLTIYNSYQGTIAITAPSATKGIVQASQGLLFSLSNIEFVGMGTVTDLANVACAGFYARNIRMRSNQDTFIVVADDVDVDDMNMEVESYGSNTWRFDFNELQETKRRRIRNVRGRVRSTGTRFFPILSDGLLPNKPVSLVEGIDPGVETLIPVANAVTPDANITTTKYVSFSANLTVNAPLDPRDGELLVMAYKATSAGLTITYNAAFKTSAVPVSTLNGVASHRFVYSATEATWIQSGGPLVWL